MFRSKSLALIKGNESGSKFTMDKEPAQDYIIFFT